MLALIWEVFYMGTSILIASFALHFFAYKKGWGDDEIKRNSDKDEYFDHDRKSILTNPFINKWLGFGGGYYGIVAFVKLVFIEFGQFTAFVKEWQGMEEFADSLGLGTLIGFFVEQMQNFISAIIWPTYYLRTYSIFECAIFVIATYFIYECSKKLAVKKVRAS